MDKTKEIQLAGRVYVRRSAGSKLYFYDIRSEGSRLQVVAQADNGDDKSPSFDEQHLNLRRGDIIGIRGYPTRTNPAKKQSEGEFSGELSIAAIEVTMLSPCLHQVCHTLTPALNSMPKTGLTLLRSPTTTMALRTPSSDSGSDTST